MLRLQRLQTTIAWLFFRGRMKLSSKRPLKIISRKSLIPEIERATLALEAGETNEFESFRGENDD